MTYPKKLSAESDCNIPKTIPIKKPSTVKNETKFEPRIPISTLLLALFSETQPMKHH